MRFKDIDLPGLRRIAEAATRCDTFTLRYAGHGLETSVRLCEDAATMADYIDGVGAVKASTMAELTKSWNYFLNVTKQASRPLPTRIVGEGHALH